jgi:putative adhesin
MSSPTVIYLFPQGAVGLRLPAMSLTEDAPASSASRRAVILAPLSGGRPAAWWWLVAVSALILLGVTVLVGVWWGFSQQTRLTSYRVVGSVAGVELDVGAANVQIDGGAREVDFRRRDRYAFGTAPSEERSVSDGLLRVASRCPRQVLGACHVSYRVSVPDNVPVIVRTTHGTVSVDGVRATTQVSTGSGAVRVRSFCGSSLQVTTASGDIGAAAECSPESIDLRSGRGDVRVAVPAGRYQVDAQGAGAHPRLRGIIAAEDAAFSLQAVSGSGSVSVEGTS